MDFKDKFIRYHPDITFEIFQLIWNKLYSIGWSYYEDVTIKKAYEEFNSLKNYLEPSSHNTKFNVYNNNSHEDQFKEITVEEFLGYNPFTKSTEIDWRKASNEELLNEAKFKYPINCTIKPIRGLKAELTITDDNFTIHTSGCKKGVTVSTDHGNGTIVENGCSIFIDGEWAEIISLPKYKQIDKPIESKEKYHEYYEFIGENINFTKGKIYKINNPTNFEAEGNFVDDQGRTNGFSGYNYKYFKHSTKEAFDLQEESKQNEVKMINKFKKDEYIVFTKGLSNSSFPLNYIFKQRQDKDHLSVYKDAAGDENGWEWYRNFNKLYLPNGQTEPIITDWRYATEEEVAEYNRLGKPYDVTTLNKPKESLKKAVHLKTQEEIEFFREKLSINPIKTNIFENYGEIAYYLNSPKTFDVIDLVKQTNYQIISFEDWCKQNNYVMETKFEFKVGDYVEIIANTSRSCNKVGDIGIITEMGTTNDCRVECGSTKPGNWSHLKELKLSSLEAYNVKYNISINDLLEEAKRRYPKGTKFHPVNSVTKNIVKNFILTTRDDNFTVYDGSTICNTGNLYVDGVWAEIVEKPKSKPSIIGCPFKEGDLVSCKIYDKYIEGKIHVEDNIIYICQNVKEGAFCRDKLGYNYSWMIYSISSPLPFATQLISHNVENLQLLNESKSSDSLDDEYNEIFGGKGIVEQIKSKPATYGESFTSKNLEKIISDIKVSITPKKTETPKIELLKTTKI